MSMLHKGLTAQASDAHCLTLEGKGCCDDGWPLILTQGGMNAANRDGNESFSNFMSTFGAVPVGGRNFFRLLQNKENVVLFPGGVREVRLPV